MRHNIFYSWQSDLPNNTNRTFIEKSIKKAIVDIKSEIPFSIDINIDRDTQSYLGSPDIPNTIFEKIDSCSFFVCDISLINNSQQCIKKTPNPNVLIELGYAAHRLGWEKILCIFNQASGSVTELPFDLRNRRVLLYNTSNNIAEEKMSLVNKIKSIVMRKLNLEKFQMTKWTIPYSWRKNGLMSSS